jgi:hypothetical protein
VYATPLPAQTATTALKVPGLSSGATLTSSVTAISNIEVGTVFPFSRLIILQFVQHRRPEAE